MFHTIKKGRLHQPAAVLVAAALLLSCGKSGPGGLAEGERLLRAGKAAEAAQVLKQAAIDTPGDWRVFNLLGMAWHRAGHHTDALRAYKKVLALAERDASLIHAIHSVHYNLGRLYLDAGKSAEAARELATYTLGAERSFAGHYWRGTAELLTAKQLGRPGMLDRAEASLRRAIELQPKSAAAFNRLALVFQQRGDGQRALASLQRAREVDPKFAPAILNLAILRQRQLGGDRQQAKQKALQLYLEYLALDDVQLVRKEAAQQALNRLNLELNPALLATLDNSPKVPSPGAPIGPLMESNQVVTVRFPVGGNGPVRGTIISNLPPAALRPTIPQVRPPFPVPRPPVVPKPPVAVVQVPEPVKPVTPPQPKPEPPPVAKVEPPQPAPVKPKPTKFVETLPSLPGIERYPYQKPAPPQKGDREAANKHFKKALHAHKLNQLPAAMAGYREALKADPGYQQAHGNLALAAYQAGALREALQAYEMALALNPLSLDSRYHFALALNKGGYYIDAARELDRLLLDYPKLLSGHLLMANLFDKHLEQPRRARTHYAKVIQINPAHAEASSIRQWLSAHP